MHKQRGMVLVTGMVFLLIVSLACFATLENIRFFSANDSDRLHAYRDFYQLEDLLLSHEKKLLQTNFTLDEMNAFLVAQKIVDNSHQDFSQHPEQLWQMNSAAIEEQAELVLLQEFLGLRHEQLLNPESNEHQDLVSSIVRISVWRKGNQNRSLQSWIQLFPEESKAQLDALHLSAHSRRIAWYE